MVRLGSLLLAALALGGCAFLGVPPASPAPQAPARWEERFCTAQEWVAVARVRMNQARMGIGRAQTRERLEDLGDDAADAAERALAFLALVPDWEPGAELVDAERTMLQRAITSGELLEELAERGTTSADDLRPVRMGFATMATAMRRAAMIGRRAEAAGIPCAVPMLAPLVPPEAEGA
jgi:hypothetical protein